MIPHVPGRGLQRIGPIAIRNQVRADGPFRVAREIFDAIVAQGDAEVLGGDVLQLVSLVDHGVVAPRDHFTVIALPHRRVGAEQVMVDDDHIGLGGTLAHAGDEALVVARALRADTVFAAGGDVFPEGKIFGEILEL